MKLKALLLAATSPLAYHEVEVQPADWSADRIWLGHSYGPLPGMEF